MINKINNSSNCLTSKLKSTSVASSLICVEILQPYIIETKLDSTKLGHKRILREVKKNIYVIY